MGGYSGRSRGLRDVLKLRLGRICRRQALASRSRDASDGRR